MTEPAKTPKSDIPRRGPPKSARRSAMLRAFVKDYEWVHIGIGLFGNLLFFVGSVFFIWSLLEPAGVWLFIIGSFAMLIGSLGEAVIRWERRIARRGESSGALG